MGHECRARVHEYAYENRYHRVGQDVDVDERVTHEQCCQQGKDDDEGVKHRQTARFLEVVFSVERQVEREAHHEDGGIE